MSRKKLILIIFLIILIILIIVIVTGVFNSGEGHSDNYQFTWEDLNSFKVEKIKENNYLVSGDKKIKFLIPLGWIVNKKEDNISHEKQLDIYSPDYKTGKFNKKIKGCIFTIRASKNKFYIDEFNEKYKLLNGKGIVAKKLKTKKMKFLEEITNISGINSYKSITEFSSGYSLAGAYKVVDLVIPLSNKDVIYIGAFLVDKKCNTYLDNFLNNISISI